MRPGWEALDDLSYMVLLLGYERRLAWWTGHSGGSLGVDRMYAMYVELS